MWFHADHLTSTRLMTDASGAKVAHYDYAIFGEKTHESGVKAAANQKGFTSHEHDDELGLIYMKARYYDPVLGRFISPDSIIPEPGDPQSWNRYAYVRNNPFNNTDPTGHYLESALDAASLASGLHSISQWNSSTSTWSKAADVVGVAMDGAALAVPFVPGGASFGIKVAREGGEQLIKHADDAAEVITKVTGKADGGCEGCREGRGCGWCAQAQSWQYRSCRSGETVFSKNERPGARRK